jgi:hypothetical protein
MNPPPLTDSLDELTAEKCRQCVKQFEELDYSPAEAETAEKLGKEIAKHAQLGFREFVFKSELSDKMKAFLQRRGFHVVPIYSFRDEYYEFIGIFRYGDGSTFIQWGVPPSDPVITSWEQSFNKEEMDLLIKGFNAEAEAKTKAREDARKQTHEEWRANLVASMKAPTTRNPPEPPQSGSGCFPLLAIPFLATAIIYFAL